jgi:opacity protein-like surface antigen
MTLLLFSHERILAFTRNANLSTISKGENSMSVKKTLILSAAAALALGSTAVLAGGPDHMSAGRCGDTLRHGFYFGAGPSYSFGDIDTTDITTATNNVNMAARGWGVGAYAGWDTMATENFSIGAQAFLNFYDVDVVKHNGASDIDTDLEYNYGVAIEPGYHPAHNVNLYGRLGFADGHFEVKNTTSASSSTFSEFGWLVGFGSELALGHHISARAQYTYYDYSKKTLTSADAIVRPKYGEVQLGVSYHL